ncbi:hypothetical protein BCR44DRAFT_1231213 [Catenaria anguillulae PL171]|uniref:Uncharacterized protein n=1 Tax=Catenaria anguillulae PL171 TaxID=765915 RepID=A0A1Y2HDQ6_9FUNG|nr:hypothetical protein BCR44DRAFT_1231213 [Catenaria anguillulae PL171]
MQHLRCSIRQPMYEVGSVMTVGDLLAAHEKLDVRSMFTQAYPLAKLPAVMRALESAGFRKVAEVEKVAVAFHLSHEYIADHFAQVGIRTITGYSPTHEFKVTFIWSEAVSRFVASEQGVRHWFAIPGSRGRQPALNKCPSCHACGLGTHTQTTSARRGSLRLALSEPSASTSTLISQGFADRPRA